MTPSQPNTESKAMDSQTSGALPIAETKAKHTPGQWFFDHDADGDFAIFGGETGNKLLAVTNSDTPEDEANAYLFCASPNMLSALKAISHRGKGRNDVLRSFMEHNGIAWLPTESPLAWMARIAVWATKKAESSQ